MCHKTKPNQNNLLPHFLMLASLLKVLCIEKIQLTNERHVSSDYIFSVLEIFTNEANMRR